MSGRSRWGCASILWGTQLLHLCWGYRRTRWQLYVEIQTELDHSDIHVLDLEEDELGVGQSFICQSRAWTIGELNFIPYL